MSWLRRTGNDTCRVKKRWCRCKHEYSAVKVTRSPANFFFAKALITRSEISDKCTESVNCERVLSDWNKRTESLRKGSRRA
ncbi:hypothetical protein RUM44_008667 [Polyplax serrata]|uniref:Uncharacterized protein n=1 Tax=Polyplax serrata TaxID=468196 RepID=A0ABR1B8W7_POLSC